MTGGVSWPLVDEATSTAPGLFGREAGPLHQRDREGAGGHRVGDRGAGIEPAHGRGHHRRLGRAAAQVTEQREGQLDEVVAGARLLQDRAEQHEQEDQRGETPSATPNTPSSCIQ